MVESYIALFAFLARIPEKELKDCFSFCASGKGRTHITYFTIKTAVEKQPANK